MGTATQMSMFEITEQSNKPEPLIKAGDAVYVLSLDVVLRGIIERNWICKNSDFSQYYGYSVDYDNGSHTVVWDFLFGETVFTDEESAKRKAESLSFVKITPEELRLEDCRSFEYVRGVDNHRLTATAAKVGESQIYEQSYMCYHFLRKYQSEKKRDEEYKRLLKKILNETVERGGVETSEAKLDTLYKVTEELYASREYAKFNGDRRLQG